MKKKIVSLFLSAVAVVAMSACSSQSGPTVTAEPKPEKVEANITFEDGKYDFAMVGTGKASADNSNLSVVDYNGSKALFVENVDGGKMYVGFDLEALVGENIANVATVQMDIGVAATDGTFSPCSGKLYVYSGEEFKEKEAASWSVYLATENPKTVFLNVADLGLMSGHSNYICLSKEDDAGATVSNLYIDNIAFIDAEGNVIEADTAAVMNPAPGFLKEQIEGPEGSVVVEFDESYGDDWSLHGAVGLDVLSQFPGQDIKFTYKVIHVDGSDFKNFAPVDAASGWKKMASEVLDYNYFTDWEIGEETEGQPIHLQNDGFLIFDDRSVDEVSFTISAERIEQMLSNGVGFGIQTAGIYCKYAIIQGVEPGSEDSVATSAEDTEETSPANEEVITEEAEE